MAVLINSNQISLIRHTHNFAQIGEKMKLEKFTVSRYRSIDGAQNIVLGKDTTVLVGKNNEGKSNLLRALNLAIGQMKEIAKTNSRPVAGVWNPGSIIRHSANNYRNMSYDFKVDFPKKKSEKGKQTTNIKLHFSLSDNDITEFKKELKLGINNELTLEFIYNQQNTLKINVYKRGGRNWQDKIVGIIKFVSNRIGFNYIPAVRTEDSFMDIINKELRFALRKVETDANYEAQLKKLQEIEEKATKSISDKISEELKYWLPNTTGVRIDLSDMYSRNIFLRRNINLFVTSSGTETLLENKGDGVKSLFALALLANNADKSSNSILAIDEPEAHLHPEAIHLLQKTVADISSGTQVLIATHNPIFVNKSDEASNIIVDSGSVHKAKKIQEIREILGVEIEDNLTNANKMIVVEGLSDQIYIKRFIQVYGTQLLKNRVKSGSIAVFNIHGVGKLKINLQYFQNIMVDFFVILDNDKPALNAVKESKNASMINENAYSFIPKESYQNEVELENLYNSEFVNKVCFPLTNLDITDKLNDYNHNNKWSVSMEKIFSEIGSEWNKEIETLIKADLANELKTNAHPETLLTTRGQEFTKTLINKMNNYFSLTKNIQ